MYSTLNRIILKIFEPVRLIETVRFKDLEYLKILNPAKLSNSTSFGLNDKPIQTRDTYLMNIISKKVAFLLLKLGYLDTKIRIFGLNFE